MSSIWNLTTMVGGGGELLFTGPKTSPAIMSAETSPIDVLLAALGHCLALSAKITLEARKLGIDLITVKLRAEKASAKPNRLEKIRAELIIWIRTALRRTSRDYAQFPIVFPVK